LLKNDKEVILLNYKSFAKKPDELHNFFIVNQIDYVFTHLSFHDIINVDKVLSIFSDIKSKKGTKFIHTCGDARVKDRYMDDISSAFHAAFVSNKDLQKNGSDSWKIPTFYCPYASLTYPEMGKYDPTLDFKMPLFTGLYSAHTDRKHFITKIKKIMPIKIIETQSGNDLRHRTLDVSRSNVILGLCTGYDIDGFIDVRPFQYMGAGALMIARKFKGMDEVIPDDLYYSFDSYDDAEVVKNHWKRIEFTGDEILNKKREQIFKYMQQNHSSKVRIKWVMEKINEI